MITECELADKTIAIVGCGRSGTLYSAKYFRGFGLDIEHERWECDGNASWYLCLDNQYNASEDLFMEIAEI